MFPLYWPTLYSPRPRQRAIIVAALFAGGLFRSMQVATILSIGRPRVRGRVASLNRAQPEAHIRVQAASKFLSPFSNCLDRAIKKPPSEA
jgi:hypothetical protein